MTAVQSVTTYGTWVHLKVYEVRGNRARLDYHEEVARRPVPFALVRVFLLAAVSVTAAGYALVRYYTHPHMPMLVPAPPGASTPTGPESLDGGEIPAPELVPLSGAGAPASPEKP